MATNSADSASDSANDATSSANKASRAADHATGSAEHATGPAEHATGPAEHATGAITKVLIANRGEIAVRIVRAARDAGLTSVACYADQDADGLCVRLADEAYALNGATPADTYLDIDKIIAVANQSGADAIHPGYGFLAENAGFARATEQAGLTWIGPPPEAIEALGDKVSARQIAERVGAPLTPGTPGPVDADAAQQFVREHGLPIAIKAAHGGGGRGLKVARTLEEIPAQFESATREAKAAFGRGECFVERYLDKPRHVETQCLADRHGNVIVVSTRDCSLQRRHQKLVEEAPAPFLTDEQRRTLYDASKAILREAGYVGAGTCEFLLAPDGTIAFLEVNARLQVEHPVSEEVSGLDLVREQFRIAEGAELGTRDPETTGHSIEFRINAEEPATGFLPAPGTLLEWHPPGGPGVRVDEGYLAPMTVPGAYDSLIAKIIVTGADREQALQRARRALAETHVAGMPTVLPFHRAVLDEPAFTGADGTLGVHTRWIETEWTNETTPYAGPRDDATQTERRPIVVEVNGKRLEVVLPADLASAPSGATNRRPARAKTTRAAASTATADALISPMQGTVVQVPASDGDRVSAGDIVVVIEAMKMEQPVKAHRDGIISGLTAQPGQTIAGGSTLCTISPPGQG